MFQRRRAESTFNNQAALGGKLLPAQRLHERQGRTLLVEVAAATEASR